MKDIYLLFILTLLCACHHQPGNGSDDLIELFVDDQYEERNLSELVESIRVIPLETTDQSLIGSIADLGYDDGNFFVLDGYNQLVSQFDEKGQFIRKLVQRGNGPDDIQHPQMFSIDKLHNEVWLSNNTNFMRFDYHGNYLGKRDYQLDFTDWYIDEDYDIYFYTGKHDNAHNEDGFMTGDLTLLTTNGQKKTWFKSDIIGYYKPNMTKLSFGSSHPFSPQPDGSVTFSYTFNDTIYCIKNKQIHPKYCVHLTGNSLPSGKLNNMPGEEIDKYIQEHPSLQWNMNSVFETPAYLLFGYGIGFHSWAWVLYEKATKKLTNVQIKDDLFGTPFLPIKDSSGDSFLTAMMIENMELNPALAEFIGKERYERLKMLLFEDNPVILEFTFKKQL